eukprot:gene3757-4279_t
MAVGVGEIVFRKKEDEYRCCANDVINMKLVTSKDDIEDPDNSFQPEMSHQIFGENESIFGYKGLNVKIYCHAGSLLTYLGMEYKEIIPDSFQIEVDKVLPNIAEKLSPGYCTNLDEFIAKFPEESSFKPMGTKLHSYKRDDDIYEIYQADISVQRLREYHERLQPFILWYIDAAMYIDVDDERWNFFLVFMKTKGHTADYEYRVCGYMTVYHYYAYPSNLRPRISQMLLLPPYQRKGHGAELLKTVNKYYERNDDVIDITVEDPSDDFIRLRDFLDCKRCKTLPAFSDENLKKGFNKDMTENARKKFKIPKNQARRAYEILRLQVTNTADAEEYRNYRLDVKQRLNIPFQKEARDMKKLQNNLSSEEIHEALKDTINEERLQRLDEGFKELEQNYRRVIDRLATA